MTTYFDREQSIEYRLGSETGPVLQTIANRFCADNPAVPVQYSLREHTGIFHYEGLSGRNSSP